MSIYKQASRKMLRFESSKGLLTVEQLWKLSLTALKEMIKSVNEAVKKESTNDGLDFLEDTFVEQSDNKLKFEVLKDIYTTKLQENKDFALSKEKREQREKIAEIISRKKNAELEGMSLEELENKLKELS